MRTTLAIDNDVLAAAQTIAHEQRVSLGRALSDLARKGLRGSAVSYSNPDGSDLPVFKVSEDAPAVTPEMIKSAEDDL
jgi:hypothetical protein